MRWSGGWVPEGYPPAAQMAAAGHLAGNSQLIPVTMQVMNCFFFFLSDFLFIFFIELSKFYISYILFELIAFLMILEFF